MYHACIFQGEINGPAGCANTQLSLFDHSVIAHAETDAALLCATHAVESKRRMMQLRQTKGLQIAHSSEITHVENLWIVPSQSSAKKYAVDLSCDPPTCTCPDHKKNDRTCKHIFAARFAQEREGGAQLPEAPKFEKRKYTQNWRTYHPAQVKEKAKFQLLLAELCKGVEEPIYDYGRPRTPLSDVIFAAALKVYSTVSTSRFCSDLQEAREKGYLSKAPSYNSVLDYFGYQALTPYLKQLIEVSSLPLKGIEEDFAVDSSGFSTGQFIRWFDAKYAKARDYNTHDYLKAHVMVGVKTHVVTSVEVSDCHGSDYEYFKPLVNSTAKNFKMSEVSADKAYLGLSNLRLVVANGAQPFIPFKQHMKGASYRSRRKDKAGLWSRLFHLFKYHEEEFYEHYHKRSNSETVFSMVKAKFGERLRSKTREAQVNELLLKFLCHNLCVIVQSIFELGIEPAFWQEDFSGETANDPKSTR
jgi:transposase